MLSLGFACCASWSVTLPTSFSTPIEAASNRNLLVRRCIFGACIGQLLRGQLSRAGRIPGVDHQDVGGGSCGLQQKSVHVYFDFLPLPRTSVGNRRMMVKS
ncbi:uncharacterized protein FOBCDRAFT_231994 [Fusarium oxysporum Fo47]|uniref:uncharacterized protein n=1 Tax=Fusarium oxysporum Fo47 TaxID=660027 RepID=UPI002869C32A|nr:uncharacterized protein FOBCDRAFT_231994 [Fusarium oxysporum Fo47]WJG36176.1 hypothetical protein FOBCDRAFT_231994 [Fusarium oxysporum Fo47]